MDSKKVSKSKNNRKRRKLTASQRVQQKGNSTLYDPEFDINDRDNDLFMFGRIKMEWPG